MTREMTREMPPLAQGFGAGLSDLAVRARPVFADAVNGLLRDGCRAPQEIERTLDYLLTFCYDAAILDLYRRLCRYYFSLSPSAAVGYIAAYRELWDAAETKPSEEIREIRQAKAAAVDCLQSDLPTIAEREAEAEAVPFPDNGTFIEDKV